VPVAAVGVERLRARQLSTTLGLEMPRAAAALVGPPSFSMTVSMGDFALAMWQRISRTVKLFQGVMREYFSEARHAIC
jgi:hypothetical protein